MISAYRVGFVAGGAAHAKKPRCTENEARTLAQETLALRKQQGIAHLAPEAEFLAGFLDGYRAQIPSMDGLQMFSDEQVKKLNK